MAVQVRTLKPVENAALLDALRRESSMEYQNRIPKASQAGVEGALAQLQKYRPQNNEFISALVNRIGLEIARTNSWTNPLKEFKRGMLTFGDTIEEINVGLIEATGYDPDREVLEGELFGTARPEVQSSFHKINRMDKYKVTVNELLLQRAFLEPQGLSNFVTGLMAAPTTSDNWDEFLLTCSLFPLYESNGGFFKVHVPDVVNPASTPDDAKGALRIIRAVADNLAFLSTKYNASHMPVSATADELLLFVTPEFKAAIDVEALAAAFNISHAQMHGRIIPIPADQFGIDGVQAIMTTSDFFVIADTVFETSTMYNPGNLQSNHWLHHHQVISASRFVPAILFTKYEGDDETVTIDPAASVSAITWLDRDNAVPSTFLRGEIYAASADVTYVSGATDEGVRWSVSGNTDYRTFITQYGVLHISGTEGSSSLTVTATATFLDPDNLMQDGKSVTGTVAVTGASVAQWPVANSATAPAVTGITISGVPVSPAFAAGTFAYTAVVPAWDGTVKSVVVTGVDRGDLKISVNAAKTVATIAAPGAPGDPVYTVTVSAA